jgi:hypothetical protein
MGRNLTDAKREARSSFNLLDEVEPLQVLFADEFVERRDFDFGNFPCSSWCAELNVNLVI